MGTNSASVPALGELEVGDAGRALVGCGEGGRAYLPVIADFDDSFDIAWYPDSDKTVIEGCCQAPGFIEAVFPGFLGSHGLGVALVDPFRKSLDGRPIVNG